MSLHFLCKCYSHEVSVVFAWCSAFLLNFTIFLMYEKLLISTYTTDIVSYTTDQKKGKWGSSNELSRAHSLVSNNAASTLGFSPFLMQRQTPASSLHTSVSHRQRQEPIKLQQWVLLQSWSLFVFTDLAIKAGFKGPRHPKNTVSHLAIRIVLVLLAQADISL